MFKLGRLVGREVAGGVEVEGGRNGRFRDRPPRRGRRGRGLRIGGSERGRLPRVREGNEVGSRVSRGGSAGG